LSVCRRLVVSQSVETQQIWKARVRARSRARSIRQFPRVKTWRCRGQTETPPLGSTDFHALSGGPYWLSKHCAFLQDVHDKVLHTGREKFDWQVILTLPLVLLCLVRNLLCCHIFRLLHIIHLHKMHTTPCRTLTMTIGILPLPNLAIGVVQMQSSFEIRWLTTRNDLLMSLRW